MTLDQLNAEIAAGKPAVIQDCRECVREVLPQGVFVILDEDGKRSYGMIDKDGIIVKAEDLEDMFY